VDSESIYVFLFAHLLLFDLLFVVVLFLLLVICVLVEPEGRGFETR
jgi:hypothetical protein